MAERETCPIDDKTLAVMLRHCESRSCDGCPGRKLHCLGREWMTRQAAARLEQAAETRRNRDLALLKQVEAEMPDMTAGILRESQKNSAQRWQRNATIKACRAVVARIRAEIEGK